MKYALAVSAYMLLSGIAYGLTPIPGWVWDDLEFDQLCAYIRAHPSDSRNCTMGSGISIVPSAGAITITATSKRIN